MSDVVALLARARQDKEVNTLLKLCMDVHIPVFESKNGQWTVRSADDISNACSKAKDDAFHLLKQETLMASNLEGMEIAIETYKTVAARLDDIIELLKEIDLLEKQQIFIEVFNS